MADARLRSRVTRATFFWCPGPSGSSPNFLKQARSTLVRALLAPHAEVSMCTLLLAVISITLEVSNGVVIAAGAIHDGPHRLEARQTRAGAVLILDGVVLDRLPRVVNSPARAVHPGPYRRPEGVEGLAGSGFPEYLGDLYASVRARHGRLRALRAVEAVADASPLAARAFVEDNAVVLVDALTGQEYEIGVDPLVPGTQAALSKRVAERLQLYREFLEGGGAILSFAAQGTYVFLPRNRVADVLLPTLLLIAGGNASAGSHDRLRKLWDGADVGLQLAATVLPNDNLHTLIKRLQEAPP